jgi:hypothetical protein
MLRASVADTASHFDADPDPTFHFDAVPDLDPSFKKRLKTLKKGSNRLIFHTFWLVICKIDADRSGASLSL